MEQLLKKYRSVMISSRIISMLAGSWMLVLAGRELFGSISGALTAENTAWDVVVRTIMSEMLLTAAFVARLVALSNIGKLRYSSVASSWVAVAVFGWGSFLDVFPGIGQGSGYHLLNPDRFATWFLIFILLSGVRFTITVAIALSKSDEISPYS